MNDERVKSLLNSGIKCIGDIDRCNDCGSRTNLLFHHISYDPEIVQVLCESCNIKFHKKHPDIKISSTYKRRIKGKPAYTTITLKKQLKRDMEDFCDEMRIPRHYSWGDVIEMLMKEYRKYQMIKNRYKLR